MKDAALELKAEALGCDPSELASADKAGGGAGGESSGAAAVEKVVLWGACVDGWGPQRMFKEGPPIHLIAGWHAGAHIESNRGSHARLHAESQGGKHVG